MANVTDAQTVEGANIVQGVLSNNGWQQGFATQVTSNSTITLTVASPHVQHFSGTTAGQIVKLPVATTLGTGQRFDFYNLSTQTVTIQNSAGTVLLNLIANSSVQFLLTDASTSIGTWVYRSTVLGTAAGIIQYHVVSSASFAPGTGDILVTGMTVTPVAGTYAIWYNGSSQIVTNNITVTTSIFNGTNQITDSIRTATSSVSTFNTIISTQTVATFNGTNACEVHTSRTGGTLTVTGRSMILARLGD